MFPRIVRRITMHRCRRWIYPIYLKLTRQKPLMIARRQTSPSMMKCLQAMKTARREENIVIVATARAPTGAADTEMPEIETVEIKTAETEMLLRAMMRLETIKTATVMRADAADVADATAAENAAAVTEMADVISATLRTDNRITMHNLLPARKVAATDKRRSILHKKNTVSCPIRLITSPSSRSNPASLRVNVKAGGSG